uniref:SAWADEE domain-containing protein n=1 Tax=Oryza glumipatula TaxID=40148 RepID=A0A0E0B1S2_9ORYZ
MERRSSVRFAPSEIARMEKLVTHKKERVLDEIFCRKLAEEFNCSPGRVGSKALQAVQVQEWFRQKFPASTVIPPCLPTGSEEKALASQASAPVSEEKPPSSEENALAVDTSISNDIGEEVRVRFQGFGAEEDEWINVRKAIRLQSIPLESSECKLIREGDLVLCFKESNDEALHFDAHVLEIQRKQHDIRGCRCVFLVEYDHDGTQERVNLRRLSRRPKHS